MTINPSGKPMHLLREWYRTPLGCRVAEAERLALSTELSTLRLGYVVVVGPLNDYLGVAPTLRQWHGGVGGDLRLDPCQMPFQAQSLDCLVLGHVLDLVDDPQAVMREAYQVLRPEGRLLILSFNPLGPWGVARLIGCWRWGGPPWCGRQWPAEAMGMRLRQMGFAEIGVKFICHRFPVQRSRVLGRLDSWEQLVDRAGLGRLSAAVQLVTARRRESAGLSALMGSRMAPGRLTGSAQPASGYQRQVYRLTGLQTHVA